MKQGLLSSLHLCISSSLYLFKPPAGNIVFDSCHPAIYSNIYMAKEALIILMLNLPALLDGRQQH